EDIVESVHDVERDAVPAFIQVERQRLHVDRQRHGAQAQEVMVTAAAPVLHACPDVERLVVSGAQLPRGNNAIKTGERAAAEQPKRVEEAAACVPPQKFVHDSSPWLAGFSQSGG